jgi:hypothetical protein
MKLKLYLLHCLTLLAVFAPSMASTQPLITGFLCCNLRSDSSGWITDMNYEDPGKHLLRAGTPVTMTGYGRSRFEFDVTGGVSVPRKNYWIGNDYSRALNPEQFSARYIVTENPEKKLARYPAKVRKAIRASRVSTGMTKEQVLMALGYPTANETPQLGSSWKYYLSSSSPFTVIFKGNKVTRINTDRATLAKVLAK